MAREFILKEKLTAPIKINFSDGAFSLHFIEDGTYKIRMYDADGDIENTLIFTFEQIKCLYLLLSKEA